MGLSATLDLKRPTMESECHYNLRKEDGVEGNDSMRLLDRASPPLHNGHMLDDRIGECAAEPSVSGIVAIFDNGSIDTLSHNECTQQEANTKGEHCEETTVVCSSQRHSLDADCVTDGGNRLLDDTGTLLASSAQIVDASEGFVKTGNANAESLSKEVVEIASHTDVQPTSSAIHVQEIIGKYECAEQKILDHAHSSKPNQISANTSHIERKQSVTHDEATTSAFVAPPGPEMSQESPVSPRLMHDTAVCEELTQESPTTSKRICESSVCDMTQGSPASSDVIHVSAACGKLIQKSQDDPNKARGPTVCELVQESPASPDPVREVSWLPPLYVPEIPLSFNEKEEEQQHSLDCDPQLMQAVLELSTSVDASSLAVSKKPSPPMPVPIEQPSMVRSYGRTYYARSIHSKRGKMPKRHHQQTFEESAAVKRVEEAGKTFSETAHEVGDAIKQIENHTSKATTPVHRRSVLGAHSDSVAGTSRVMAPLTVNTELKRSSPDMRKKSDIASAPLSTSCDRSNLRMPEWNSRRQSSTDLATDERITLPTEQTLNKALDLLRTKDTCLSLDSSAQPSPFKTIPVKSPQVKKEVAKRKTIQDRLDRIREQNALVLSIPAFHNANTTQLAILLRRFKKYWKVRNYLSEELVEHVLNNENTDSQTTSKTDLEKLVMDKDTRAKLRAFREASDPEATESSSDEDDDMPDAAIPSTSDSIAQVHISRNNPLYRFCRMRAEFGALQMRAEYEEEECAKMIEITRQQLMELEAMNERFTSEAVEERGCARCIPVKSTLRRKILKRNLSNAIEKNTEVVATSTNAMERIAAYASIDGRLSQDLSSLSAVPLRRRIDTYLRRKSMRPPYFMRLSWDRAPWISYLQNKRGRGISEERRKRKRDTDRNDSSSPLRKARRNSCASRRRVSMLKHAGSRLVRRSLNYKRNGERMHNEKDAHAPERRHSTASVNHGAEAPPSSECGFDSSVLGLRQKIDYKEISIPKWKRLPADALSMKVECPCTGVAEMSCAAEISRMHLPLELDERKRFQQYRDNVASKALAASSKLSGTHSKMSATHSKNSAASQSKLSGAGSVSYSTDTQSSSHSPSAAPSPAPAVFQYDDEHSNSFSQENTSVPFYDRPSVVEPYSPRQFPLPPSLLHKHLT